MKTRDKRDEAIAHAVAQRIWEENFSISFEMVDIEELGIDPHSDEDAEDRGFVLPEACNRARFIAGVEEALTQGVDSTEQIEERAKSFEHLNVKVHEESITATFSLVPGGCFDTEETELNDVGRVRYPSLE